MFPWSTATIGGVCTNVCSERRLLPPLVDAQDEPARLLAQLRRGLVVEHRDRPVVLPSHVVLPAEADAAAELEVASACRRAAT